MTEARMRQQARAKLEALGAVVTQIHGSAYQSAAVDLLGCYRGRALALEGKLPGRKLTPRQTAVLAAWARAGAITGVFFSPDEAVAIVRRGTDELA